MSEKIPHITASELIKVLKKLGFTEDRKRGSHVVLMHYQKKLRTVVPSHKGKVIPVGT
jgi:predicted RNA binding protein YcfA (HicA-like mRNA interferase family)